MLDEADQPELAEIKCLTCRQPIKDDDGFDEREELSPKTTAAFSENGNEILIDTAVEWAKQLCSICLSGIIKGLDILKSNDRHALNVINSLSPTNNKDGQSCARSIFLKPEELCAARSLPLTCTCFSAGLDPSTIVTCGRVFNHQSSIDWAMKAINESKSRQEEVETESIELEDAELRKQVQKAHQELDRIKKYHLLNRCFFIWVVGEFGVINGCRLGRLTTCHVTANEFNNALGDVALLMKRLTQEIDLVLRTVHSQNNSSLAKSIPHKFSSRICRILVKGRHSWLAALDGSDQELPLFQTDNPIGYYFHAPKLNQALILLLSLYTEMVSVLNTAVMNSPPPTEPFLVQHHTVAGESIRYRKGHENSWTAALRYFLIDLKWLIGHHSNVKNQLVDNTKLIGR